MNTDTGSKSFSAEQKVKYGIPRGEMSDLQNGYPKKRERKRKSVYSVVTTTVEEEIDLMPASSGEHVPNEHVPPPLPPDLLFHPDVRGCKQRIELCLCQIAILKEATRKITAEIVSVGASLARAEADLAFQEHTFANEPSQFDWHS